MDVRGSRHSHQSQTKKDIMSSENEYNILDVYDPEDPVELELMRDEIEHFPDGNYDWEKLADYGIEQAWFEASWKARAEEECIEEPRWTAREFTYSSY